MCSSFSPCFSVARERKIARAATSLTFPVQKKYVPSLEKKVVALLLLFKRLVFLLQCWLYLQTIVYHDLLKSDDGIIDNIMQRRCSGSPFGHKKHAFD